MTQDPEEGEWMTSSVGSVKSDVVMSPVGREPTIPKKQTKNNRNKNDNKDIWIRTEPTIDKGSKTIQEQEFRCETNEKLSRE